MHAPDTWTPRAVELLRLFLRHGGLATVRANGGSMDPAIKTGQSVVVEHADPSKIASGDVIVFRRDGLLVAHRVARIEQGPTLKFTTRGDASEEDPPVEESEIIGRVVGSGRNAARVAFGRAVRRVRSVGGRLKRAGLRLLLRLR